MNRRQTLLVAAALAFASCGGGTPEPPALEYGHGPESELTYVRGDTTIVSLSMMGQSLEIEQRGVMSLGVTMSNTAAGADVRMSVLDLDASISNPMGAPMSFDETTVDGDVVFSLDRRGDATVESLPTVSLEASQMVSATALANGFFPGLPGGAPSPGESWVDTLTYESVDASGLRSAEESITTYTIVGPDTFEGRAVLRIELSGTSSLSNEFDMQGMSLSQESDVEVEGHLLWDHQRGVMVERVQNSSGSGRVSGAPVPLPIEIESRQVTRLGGM
ncbi:MAG: hypothetical protein AAF389_20120 [Gemmatimonadota bacterium]